MAILGQADIVSAFTDEDYVLVVFGNEIARISMADLKKGLIKNNDLYLNQVAFFIDVNEPAETPLNVNTGGNKQMFKMWKDQWKSGVMNADGDWAELSKVDNRYFADGTLAVDLATGNAVTGLANCNFIGKIPETWCYIQTVEIADKTIQRLWLSLLPLPGWKEDAQFTGMFKGSVDSSGRLRSLPNTVPSASKTVKAFFESAQSYGNNYGLAGVHFRNMLLWYMMGAYGQRSSQECKIADGTPVWGVGLDGTESSSGFSSQSGIKTGATLNLGTKDGKSEVLDNESAVCHSVKVLSYENPWGQYFEMDGHMCSIGNDVVVWRENFMPTAVNPTINDFNNIKTALITRHSVAISSTSSTGAKMNLLALADQGAFMIPYATQAGITYGDSFSYASEGQLWLWGGNASNGATCGLAYVISSYVFWYSYSAFGSRLAFFGIPLEVTGQDLIV